MSTNLIFEGTCKSECESFVHAVRNHARVVGRSRDNDWIIDFVAACFLGDALHWYEELGPTVQNDWDLLRKAILGWHSADTTDSEDEVETYVQRLVLSNMYYARARNSVRCLRLDQSNPPSLGSKPFLSGPSPTRP